MVHNDPLISRSAAFQARLFQAMHPILQHLQYSSAALTHCC